MYRGDIFFLEAVLCIIDAGFLKLNLAKNIPHMDIITVGQLK
jgi:hypothetical protein